MKIVRPASVVAGVFLVVGAATLASATAPDDDRADTVHACYANADAPKQNLLQALLGNGGQTYNKGDLRFVEVGEDCKKHESAIDWLANDDQLVEDLAALQATVETQAEELAAKDADIAALNDTVESMVGELAGLDFDLSTVDPRTDGRFDMPELRGTFLQPGSPVRIRFTDEYGPGQRTLWQVGEDGAIEPDPTWDGTFPCSYRDWFLIGHSKLGVSFAGKKVKRGPGCPVG